jgi:hypothetical protein
VSERKGIVTYGRMPDRATRSDRIAHMDEDVRDLTARLKAEVEKRAVVMGTEGWVLLDEWEMAVNGRNVVVVGKVERP